jgi:hypothetical protein
LKNPPAGPSGPAVASRTVVPLADLAREPLARWPEAAYPGGTGPLVEDVGQLFQLMTLNRTIALLPWSNTTFRAVAAFARAAITATRQTPAPPARPSRQVDKSTTGNVGGRR